ncbi:MAG: hypothetical protein WAV64_04530 [Candidatus Moraniibacteriota bacterium]
MNIKKSLIQSSGWVSICLGIFSLVAFSGTTNIAYGDDGGYCTPDYSCAASTCLLSTCVDPNCGQTIYGQKSDQSCIDNMPCTQTLAGEIGNCTGNPTTPANPGSATPTDPTQSGGSGGKSSADALTKPGDLLVYMGTYGTAEGGDKYTAECQAVYAQIQADLTAHASDINWYNEYIAEIKVRNMSALLEETVEIMGDGLSGQGAIDFVNKYVNPIVVSKNYLAYSSAEVTAVMATQTGNGTGLNDDKDKLTSYKISSMFSNSARYNGPASDGCIEAFQPFYCANLWITGDKETYKCCKTPAPPQGGCECSGNPDEPTAFSPVIYCATGKTCQDCKCVAGTTPTRTTPTGTPSLSASATNDPAPLDVNFTLTNGTGCINYMCGVGFGASEYEYEKSFRCTYPTAGTYVASIECAGSKIEKTISVTDSGAQNPTLEADPNVPSCTAFFSPTGITSPSTAYLTYASSGADKLLGGCTGEWPVPVADYGLAYTHYPFPFTAGQQGKETCTFTPYKGTTPGKPCEAKLTVGLGSNTRTGTTDNPIPAPARNSNPARTANGSAVVTASFNADTINSIVGSQPTESEVAYLTWNSSGASKLEVACTGPANIPRDNIQLTSDLWQTDAAKSGFYVKPAGAPDGYPGWFPKGTSDTEICTFYPTNLDGSAGTPVEAIIEVTLPGASPGEIIKPGITCPVLQMSADSCPKGLDDIIENGKDKNGCPTYGCKSTGVTINNPIKNNYVCQPDNADCAAKTCHNVYCNDGCNMIKGTDSCTWGSKEKVAN